MRSPCSTGRRCGGEILPSPGPGECCCPCKHTRGCQVPSTQFGVASLLGPPWRLFLPTLRVSGPPLGAQPPPAPRSRSTGILPSAEPRSFHPMGVTLPPAVPQHPKNTHLLLTPLRPMPTLPKPFLTERWDFGAFCFFFSPCFWSQGLYLTFSPSTTGRRSEQGLPDAHQR